MRRIRPGMPPISIQIAVAERQARQHDPAEIINAIMQKPSTAERLNYLLALLFGEDGETAHLDHNPALRVRVYNPRIKDTAARYTPHAHNPDFLIWRTKHAHHIKTNVRGDGAQFPDRVLIKRERRREKATRAEPTKSPRLPSRAKLRTPKRAWPEGRKIMSRPWHS